jgi:endonuclease YncB( thermonuclease family)
MLFSAAPALADGCQPVIQSDGVVSAVIDPRTLRLDDGRDVRLAGVEVVAGEAANRQPALAGLIGRHVILRGERDDPDRYGRQTAFIYLGPSASSVQSDLLARGDALVSADVTEKACAAELTAAETAARQARRGTWAESSVVKNAERPGIFWRVLGSLPSWKATSGLSGRPAAPYISTSAHAGHETLLRLFQGA